MSTTTQPPLISGARPGTYAAATIPAGRDSLRKYRQELGKRLRAAREGHGLGVREFARMIGMNAGRVSLVELANGAWVQSDAERIALALDELDCNR
jgi:hypothetical protein